MSAAITPVNTAMAAPLSGGNKALVVDEAPGGEAVAGHRGEQLPPGRLGREQAKAGGGHATSSRVSAEHQAP